MKRTSGYLNSVCWIAIVLMLFNTVAWGAVTGQSNDQKNPWNAQIRLGVEGGNHSYGTDLFTDILVPIWGNNKNLIFFNPHIRLNSKSEDEENGGFGYRTLLYNDQLILGINAYFDTMDSRNDKRYTQLGGGVEALSKWVDVRANYYYPFGSRFQRLPDLDGYSFGETNLLVNKGFEEALRGFDAEAGVLIPVISNVFETRAYLGGYWYDSDTTGDINGWRTRVELRPAGFINLTAEVRDDDVRGTQTILGGYLDIPFSMDELFKGGNPFKGLKEAAAFGRGARSVRERMTEKVVRDRQIQTVAAPKHHADNVMDLIYVNKDNPNPGEGTYSNPYHDISSVPSDSRYVSDQNSTTHPTLGVYVFSSDGNPDTYNDVHFTLLPNMVFWGQGYYHPLYRLGGGPSPILDGGGYGNVITLADNNEVAGLTIQNGAEGIYGQNVRGTYIHDNTIQDNGLIASGIHIENLFADADIAGLNLTYRFENNLIQNNFGDGIYLSTQIGDPSSTGSVSDSSITNIFAGNTITGNGVTGIYSYNTVAAAGAISNVSISNTFSGNEIRDNGDAGIYDDNEITASGAISDVSISNTFSGNTITGNGAGSTDTGVVLGNFIATGTDASPITNAGIVNTFTRNDISGNYGDGVLYFNVIGTAGGTSPVTSASITNTFTGNAISDNYGDGVGSEYLYLGLTEDDYYYGNVIGALGAGSAVSGASISNSFADNAIDDNEGYGVNLGNYITAYNAVWYSDVDGSVTAGVTNASIANTFTSNTVTGNYGGGIYAENSIGSENDLWESYVAGELAATVDGSGISNSFVANTVTGNGWDGIDLYNYVYAGNYAEYNEIYGNVTVGVSNSSVTNTFANNTVTGNYGDGIYAENSIGSENDVYGSYVGGDVTVTVDGSGINSSLDANTVTGNGSIGIYFNNGGFEEGYGGVYAFNDTGYSEVDGSVIAGVTNSSIVNSFTNNTVTNNYDDGIYAENSIGSENDLWDSYVAGELAATVDGSGMSNSLVANTVTGNGWNGIDLYNHVYVGNYAEYNEIYGNVTASASGFSITNTLTDNTVNDNYGGGIYAGNFIGAVNNVYDSYVSGEDVESPEVYGSVTAGVTNSSIANTFTGNTVSDNYVEDEYWYGEGSGIYVDNFVGAVNDVWESYAAGDVTATVDGSGINNSFDTNTVTGNSGYGVYLENSLYGEYPGVFAYNYIDYAEVYGSVTAGVTNSSIANTFTNNTVTDNYGDGIYAGNAVGAENDLWNVYVAGDVTATVDGSGISNSLDANTVTGNGWSGVDLYNDVYVNNYDEAEVEGTVTAMVADTGLSSTFTGNVITGNEGDGVHIDSEIYNWDGDISDSGISSTFTDNVISSNADDGVDLYYYLYGTTFTNVAGTLSMSGNDLTSNYDGVYLYTDGVTSAEGLTYTFDITGYNSLGGNYSEGIVNYTPINVNAQYNYWGTTDATEIGNMIYDYNDESSLGEVDFSNPQ